MSVRVVVGIASGSGTTPSTVLMPAPKTVLIQTHLFEMPERNNTAGFRPPGRQGPGRDSKTPALWRMTEYVDNKSN